MLATILRSMRSVHQGKLHKQTAAVFTSPTFYLVVATHIWRINFSKSKKKKFSITLPDRVILHDLMMHKGMNCKLK